MLKDGGRIAFLVITVADDLGPDDLATALEQGPEYGQADEGYHALMERAGFTDITSEDITATFRDTQLAWIEAWEEDAAALRAAVGEEDFEERRESRLGTAAAIDAGLLGRHRFTGRVPVAPNH